MHLDQLITDLSLILIVASVVTLIMKKLNQPVVLGYIIAGFLSSPNFQYVPSIGRMETITSWAEIGIIFLMFALGLEFSFKKIANVGGSAFITALTVMTAMILIGFGTGQAIGWETMDCVFLGGMLSMSSTMIILKAYEEYNLKKKGFAQLVLGTLVIEDIAGIFMLIILSTISVSKNISGVEMASEIGILLIMLVVWLVVGIYIIPTFLKKIEKLLNEELLIMVSVAICFGMVLIANLIGFSSALGAFMAGSILAGTVKAKYIERVIKPIKDLFGAVFFVSVGMLIEPALLVKYIVPILIITVVTILGQMTFATLGMLFSGQSLYTAIRGGFSMVQIGEFSFIVATLGMDLGVISKFIYPIVVCVSVITSFTTPLFIKNADRVYNILEAKLPAKAKLFIRKNTSDAQIEEGKDTDWKDYLKMIGMRTFICAAAMFVIYFVGTRYVEPWVADVVGGDKSPWITAVVVVILMIPFTAMMHGTKKVLYTKLWLKNKSNKLPILTLQFLRILLAAAFIALSLSDLLGFPFIVVMILAFFPAYWVVKSDYIRGMARGLEMSFVANFYEQTLDKRKKESNYRNGDHWMDEDIYVVRFEMVADVHDFMVKDIGRNPHVHVGIIKVIREGVHYNMPAGTFELHKGDILHTIGSIQEIEATLLMLEKLEYIEEMDYPKETLKNYIYGQTFKHIPHDQQIICVPIVAQDKSYFAKKSIKNSGIREKYRGSIIGIERDNLPIMHPSVATIIQPGDLIWVIGTEQMAKRMLHDNLLGEA